MSSTSTTWWRSDQVKASVLSLLILGLILAIWHLATLPKASPAANLTPEQIEYLQLMGKDPLAEGGGAGSGFPTLAQMGSVVWGHITDPFYDNGPNDKGIGIQLAHSLGRVALGFGLVGFAAKSVIKYFIDAFTAFSYLPLRVASIMGMTLAALGLVYALIVIGFRLMFSLLLLDTSPRAKSFYAAKRYGKNEV